MTVYTARRLPALPGRAGWEAILPPPRAYPMLDDERSVDVAIIGAGFAGLTAACQLQRLNPHATIAMVEAGRLAENTAGRNSGFMIDLPHELKWADSAETGDDRTQIAWNRTAIAFAQTMGAEYNINDDYVAPIGKINGAASEQAEQHNKSYARHLDSLGESYEILDRQQMQAITGSPHYHGGLYTAGTVQLQPAGYVRGLANGLAARGVAIYESSPALSLQKQQGGWRVATPKGAVTAAKVILSVNGHLESFGFQRGRLLQLFLFAAMTDELDADALAKLGGETRWGITPSNPTGTTVRRIDTGQGGNRVVTRTCAVLRSNQRVLSADMTRAKRVIQQKFDQRFPQLAGAKMAYTWAGHLCMSMNGVSVVGEIDDGLYAACVQNGLGTVRGTLAGMAAAELACAELACGQSSPLTAYFAEQLAPQRLVPRPFRDVGANAVIRWREHQAGRE
ncbi:MAG: FAD-binding oxidoreductase [Alphaproteobacteria bacterium]|nr:FAD-binding oxidoreductase [Alphaproteobacteria bacterium]